MIDRGFLFHPDFEVRNQIRMIGGMPDLSQFDFIFISCSGGKDSQAMSYLISELAEKQGYPKENIELLYADTGLEWHDTFEHVKKIGQYLGIKAVQVLPKFKLLDNVRRRWMKFNGLDIEQNRTEQNNGDLPSGKTEAAQAHFRTIANDSVPAITRELQSSNMSVPISKCHVLPKSRKTVPYRKLYPEFQGGGGDKSKRPFPSQHARFCTSLGKQEPMLQYVRNHGKESVSESKNKILYRGGKGECNKRQSEIKKQGGWLGKKEVTYLMCSGERWEESSRRSTYHEWSINDNLTTQNRIVYRWRPMLAFETADIWSVIRNGRIESHEAYQLGCDRLGCTMCIFANECGRMAKDVKISFRENPEQYEELDRLETETGFTMSIAGIRVRDIVKKG